MKKLLIGLMLLAVTGVASAVIVMPPAKYNTQYTLYFSVYDSNSPWRAYETAPAAADIHVFQDGASEARATNSVTDIGRTFSLVLTAAEMSAEWVTVDINDASAPPLFGDETIYIPTFGNASAELEFDLDSSTVSLAAGGITASTLATDAITSDELAASALAEITDDVLDEVLSGGAHRVKNSVAAYIRKKGGTASADSLIVEDGTCQAGTANTITLAADASATNDIYSGMMIVLSSGTGSPQARAVIGYAGSTKVATVDKNWVTNPVGSTTGYEIWAEAGSFYSDQGTAQAGDATTITLAATASATNDIYNGFFCRIISGTGSGQTRTITDYDGGTQVATVSTGATDWSPSPDATSVYVVIPGGNIVSDNPPPTPGLSMADLYDSFVTYDVATVTDVTSGSVTIDANDLMQAVYTDYTGTPNTLGWLWYHSFVNLP